MVQYSASPNDLEMVDCFLAFHETKESPKKMQKPVVDFLELGDAPQSALEKDSGVMEMRMRRICLAQVCSYDIVVNSEQLGDVACEVEQRMGLICEQ